MDKYNDKSNLPDPHDDETSSQELNESDNELNFPDQINIDSKESASNLEITENLSDNHYINSESPQKKSKTPLILGLTFGIILVILLASGLAYAALTNMISMPFMTVEVNAPIIAATTNADGSSTITINNPNTSGTIYYTIDGSDPLTNSKKYESPITISTTTSLKARAIDEKDNMSDITSQQFTIVEKVVEKPVETRTTQSSTESIIPEEYQGTWESIKAVGIYSFNGNNYTYSSGGNVHTGTISRVEPYNNSPTILVFYPVEVNHGFTVDPGEKGDGKISIDGNTYVSEDIAASYFD